MFEFILTSTNFAKTQICIDSNLKKKNTWFIFEFVRVLHF